MKEHYRLFLETNREKSEYLVKCGTARNLDIQTLLQIYKEEFGMPAYAINIDNTNDVIEMIKLLYAAYDEWLLKQKKPVKAGIS